MAARNATKTFDDVPSQNIVRSPRQRSPNYPAISLPEAVERASKLYKADGRTGSLLEAAVRHFGFNRAHGTALALVSALRKYGLVDVANNRVTLTQRAIDILVFPDSDARRVAAIRDAALAPEIYRDLYRRYLPSGKIPSEMTLKAELEAELRFNPKAVTDFVQDFKTTLVYARLLDDGGVTLHPDGGEGTPRTPKDILKVGDYVQWEPKGILQFQEPKRIRALLEDGQFALVDGSDTGLPISELAIQSKPEVKLANFSGSLFNTPSKNTTMREDVFSLAEGQVVVKWPTPLSSESIQDLKDWLDILQRKISRSTIPTEEPK